MDNVTKKFLIELLVWFIIGSIYPISTIKRRDKITLNTAFSMFFCAIWGPVALLGFLFIAIHEFGDKLVLWQKKKDKYWQRNLLDDY